MLSNMASSLILHKRIKTTVAKAKALRMYVEPLITKSKDDSTHSRRVVFSYLKDKFAVTELFREVSVKIGSRPGGYTRILKTGNRLGDNADMCIIELVDYNENMLAEKEEAKAKTTRRSRRGKKKADTTVSAEVKEQVEQKEEIVETTEDKVDDKVEEIKVEEKEDKVDDKVEEVKVEEKEEKVEEKKEKKVKAEKVETPEKEEKTEKKADTEEKEEK
jgi:large subunit ribosomal protein L17